MNHFQNSLKRQAGVALVIGLLLLVVFAILGVTALNTTNLQERMASNSRNALVAFNNSESELRQAEQVLFDSGCEPATVLGTLIPVYDSESEDTRVTDFVTDRAWLANNSGPVSSSIVELFPTPNPDLPGRSDGGGQRDRVGGLAESHTGVSGGGGAAGAGTGDVVYRRYRISSRATGATRSEYVLTQSTYIIDCA